MEVAPKRCVAQYDPVMLKGPLPFEVERDSHTHGSNASGWLPKVAAGG